MASNNAPESQTDSVQVLILGGGPGGYSCALRAAELGLDVMLVDTGRPGGTCLHAGCIPSKALIQAATRYSESLASADPTPSVLSAMGVRCSEVALDWCQTQAWKDGIVDTLAGGVEGLLARSGVRVVRGRAEMLDGKRARVSVMQNAQTGERGDADKPTDFEVQAQHVVLAVGAREVILPGFAPSDCVLYAEQALALEKLPEHLAVVGGGYVGLELGQAFARLGVSVTIVEAEDRLLPAYPKALVTPLSKTLIRDKVCILTETRARSWNDGVLTVQAVATNAPASESEPTETLVRADKVLVAVGRQANLEGWGRDQLAIDLADGFVAVDSRGETSMSGVYAVGDITGEPMLAHRAIAQGQVVAECLAGRRREFAPVAIPAVCFTAPEIATVGMTQESAKAAGYRVVVKRFPLAANGRSLTLGSSSGFLEVVADRTDHVLLGVQAVGEHIAELVHSFTLALEMGARLEDVADTIHAHPTIGESFAEVSLAALGFGS